MFDDDDSPRGVAVSFHSTLAYPPDHTPDHATTPHPGATAPATAPAFAPTTRAASPYDNTGPRPISQPVSSVSDRGRKMHSLATNTDETDMLLSGGGITPPGSRGRVRFVSGTGGTTGSLLEGPARVTARAILSKVPGSGGGSRGGGVGVENSGLDGTGGGGGGVSSATYMDGGNGVKAKKVALVDIVLDGIS